MVKNLITCENCKFVFESDRKKRFCGRRECTNDRMNSRAKKMYKENESFRLKMRKYANKYNLKKILELYPDGLKHEICENCGKDYSYPIKCGRPKKYCSRIECSRDRDRKEYHKYVSRPDKRKLHNETCKKSHRKYYEKNRKVENEKCRNRRNKNLKRERFRDKRKNQRNREKLLILNGLPKDYIHEFKYEKIMKGILDKIFSKELSVDNKRYLLINSKIRQTYPTKKGNFEFDRYYPKLRIAFEFDGMQHRKFIPFFHRTKTAFKNQIKRDKYKNEVCSIVNITLIGVIFEELDIKIIQNKINSALNSNAT